MSKNLISKQIFLRKFTQEKKIHENLNSIVINSQHFKAREVRKGFSYEIGSTKI